MKVLFCDPLNTQNAFYTYAKYLREMGVDARVVVSENTPESHTPEWHDGGGNQDWVIRTELPYFVPFTRPAEYMRLLRNVVKLSNEFDVIGCSGLAPMWMRWSKRPFILFSYGSDVDQMANYGWSGSPDQKFGITDRVMQLIIRNHLLGSMRKAKATVLAPYQIPLASKLRLNRLTFLPHLIDTNLFRPLEQRGELKAKLREELGCDLVMFHPPRHVWDRRVFDCKGNDKVFRAFAMFLKNWGGRTKMLTVKKGWDMDKSVDLANKLGITDSVVWMDSVNKERMCQLYNAVDIVLDQFVVGVAALCALEPLACGTPSISFMARYPEGMFYPETPPVTTAFTIADICNRMTELAEDEGLRNQLGAKGREWVVKYCEPGVAMGKFIRLFEQVLDDNKSKREKR